MKLHTERAAMAVTGATERQLADWDKSILPVLVVFNGIHLYSQDDLVILAVLVQLQQCGMAEVILRHVCNELREVLESKSGASPVAVEMGQCIDLEIDIRSMKKAIDLRLEAFKDA